MRSYSLVLTFSFFGRRALTLQRHALQLLLSFGPLINNFPNGENKTPAKQPPRVFTTFFGVCVCVHSVAQSCLTLETCWTAAHQAPLSMGFFQKRILERTRLSHSLLPLSTSLSLSYSRCQIKRYILPLAFLLFFYRAGILLSHKLPKPCSYSCFLSIDSI